MAFAERGASIVFTGCDVDGARRTLARAGHPDRITFRSYDVTDGKNLTAAVDSAVARFGQLGIAADMESGTFRGRLRGERHEIQCPAEAGVPAVEVAGELVVEDTGADLEQEVGAAGRPAHLLLFDHALADDLVDRGLGERGGDGLTRAVAFPGRTGCNFGSAGVLSRV